MNFSPFGSHFSPSLPTIHQFAAKLTQDVSSSAFSSGQEDISTNNRYTANGIPSFTQHHLPTTSTQQLITTSNKTSATYPNSSNIYNQQSNLKRTFDQQTFDLFSTRNHPEKPGNFNDINKKKDLSITQSKATVVPHQNNPHQPIGSPTVLSTPWQNLSSSSNSTVADYLSQLPTSSLPISLHEFLKYSAETLKKETGNHHNIVQSNNEATLSILNNGTININSLNIANSSNGTLSTNSGNALTTINTAHLQNAPLAVKKKKKKKPEKEKKPKPKPGEIRLSTALDGSTLYCCPECHMALPERDLLEQHLMGHNMERRFVCDICGAALKRKDHLTRHKQSHNPERPFVCSVCLKAFKRKEQLTLHFVIHSGEKRHVCTECGKGFYRKDHLRKHTRSHIARRVKAELSQQGAGIHSISS